MDSWSRVPDAPDPDALAFVRFCRGRRRVAWPELYDEMWAVASRGLFRGWGFDELEGRGIGFSLSQTRRLAALVARVIAEEPRAPSRRPAASPQRQGIAIVLENPASPAGVVGVEPAASSPLPVPIDPSPTAAAVCTAVAEPGGDRASPEPAARGEHPARSDAPRRTEGQPARIPVGAALAFG